MLLSLQMTEVNCCRLIVSGEAANPTELRVTLTNIQEAPVTVFRTIPEFDLRITITADGRREPDLTAYGNRLLKDERGGSRLQKELKMGESFSQTLDVGKLYVLDRGTYTVTISRNVFIADKRIELQTKATITVP